MKAEQMISHYCKDSLIVRVPVLYGPGDFNESAILCLYNKLIDQKECFVDHIAKRTPTYTTDIAISLYTFIFSKSSIRGIVHISSQVGFDSLMYG